MSVDLHLLHEENKVVPTPTVLAQRDGGILTATKDAYTPPGTTYAIGSVGWFIPTPHAILGSS